MTCITLFLKLKEAQLKLKAESESSVKLRKSNAELSVAVKRQEAVVSEHVEKLAAAQATRDSLERNVVDLNGQLERLRAGKIQQGDMVEKSEQRCQALQDKVSGAAHCSVSSSDRQSNDRTKCG